MNVKYRNKLIYELASIFVEETIILLNTNIKWSSSQMILTYLEILLWFFLFRFENNKLWIWNFNFFHCNKYANICITLQNTYSCLFVRLSYILQWIYYLLIYTTVVSFKNKNKLSHGFKYKMTSVFWVTYILLTYFMSL